MIGWGITIVALTFAALLPMFLGLLVVLPVLGHATWHLYRKVVAPEGGPSVRERFGILLQAAKRDARFRQDDE